MLSSPIQMDMPLHNTTSDLRWIATTWIRRLRTDNEQSAIETALWFERVYKSISLPPKGRLKGRKMAKKLLHNQWSFINTNLTPGEREHFTMWCDEMQDDMVELLVKVLLDGYKISARFDNENECWIVSLTGTDQAVFNDKCSLTSRHSTFEQAVLLTIYKNSVIAQNGKWRVDNAAGEWG